MSAAIAAAGEVRPAPAAGRTWRSSCPRGPRASTPARRARSGRRSGTSSGRTRAGARSRTWLPDSSIRSAPGDARGAGRRSRRRSRCPSAAGRRTRSSLSSSSMERSRLSSTAGGTRPRRIIVAAGSASVPLLGKAMRSMRSPRSYCVRLPTGTCTRRRASRPRPSMSTCSRYNSCEISSASASSASCSAASHTSPASSSTFLPCAWTPASSAATVAEPAGRVAALLAQLGEQLVEGLHSSSPLTATSLIRVHDRARPGLPAAPGVRGAPGGHGSRYRE